jgi:DNA-binding PadR family transcriptional regulator
MSNRKPSQKLLALLAGVGDRLIARTRRGWSISQQASTAAETRILTDLRDRGWISTPSRRFLDEGETERVGLTELGREALAEHWPEWVPREEREAPPQRST